MLLESHVETCKKAAGIMFEQNAIPLYYKMSVRKKPVYFGKDIITEMLAGYKFKGYFPKRILLRSKYLFQTGIVRWWEKFFRWSLILKTRIHETKMMQEEAKNSSALPYVFM